MHVTINISPAAARRLLRQWEAEHRRYYGRPCGYRLVASDSPLAKPEYDGESQAEVPMARLGFTADAGGGGQWLRSSGTWAYVRIDSDSDSATMECRGPRHSVRELIPDYLRDEDVSWTYHETREPGLAPWETTT